MLVKFKTYWKDELCSYIEYNKSTNYIKYEAYVDNPMHLPFGVLKNPTLTHLDRFFQSRCFPEARTRKKQMLRCICVDHYDPELIVRKTHGLQAEDFMWLEFDGEHLSYDDIKVR